VAGRLDQLIYLLAILAILFPSCFFESVLNGIRVIGKHPRYTRFLAEAYKTSKKNTFQLSFKTTAQKRSKAAGGKWKSGSRVLTGQVLFLLLALPGLPKQRDGVIHVVDNFTFAKA
jgi:hypothetical protein